MAKNLTHYFLPVEGQTRRVNDRRDNSVLMFPDEDFHFINARYIGRVEGRRLDFTAISVDGARYSWRTRKDAIQWLTEQRGEALTDWLTKHSLASLPLPLPLPW